MLDTIRLGLLTLVASAIGTATGFGTWTVMIPVTALFVPATIALLFALILSIPVSFAGAYLAKRFLDRLPQKFFRIVVGVFLALVGAKLIIRA
jgi:hypothetical protein